MLVGAPPAVGELDRVGLAEVDHPGRHQFAVQGGGAVRDPVAPRGAAAHRDLALDFHQVLDGDRNAVQRADRVAGADGLVGGFGGEAGVGGVDRDERLQPGFQPLDACKKLVDQIDRGQAARGDLRRQFMDRTKGGGHGTLPAILPCRSCCTQVAEHRVSVAG